MNFIEVDNFITSCLKKNINLFNSMKQRVSLYKDISNIADGRIKDMINHDNKIIEELKFSENILFIYKQKTHNMMQKYLSILRTPIKRDEKETLKYAENTKANILREYLDTIKMYIPQNIFDRLKLSSENIVELTINYCGNCENTENFMKDGDVLVCGDCFSEVVKMGYYNNKSFNTSGTSKCNYDRINHFKECLKQYQGKQNTFINPKVYTDIENALKMNGIIKNTNNKAKKYENVKRSHIIYFLKELGYTKHYDDYILIHHLITGKPANNLSDIEEQLIEDFEQISEKYSQLYSTFERKNFINMQFILYRLLQKYKYNFDNEDFITIKSFDKNMDRDKICKVIFESLNWEYE
ncbi:DNA binding/packing protein [Dasineura jujubifolia toursvirus 2a]|nr:DNA binding/packing protein [Dasineura jujubifolia toursvirus 2a]